MRTYASSRAKRKSFYRKSELHFTWRHGCHVSVPKRCIGAGHVSENVLLVHQNSTPTVSPYKALQRCVKRPGGGILLENSWWGRAARFFKSWPHFRPKNVIFHTTFQTRPLKSIPVFRPGFRQNLCYHYIDYSANKKLFKFISNLHIFDLLSIDSVILIIETCNCNCLPFSYSRSIFQGDTSHDKCWK